MRAKWPGVCRYEHCPVSEHKIRQGDEISWTRTEKPAPVYHQACFERYKAERDGVPTAVAVDDPPEENFAYLPPELSSALGVANNAVVDVTPEPKLMSNIRQNGSSDLAAAIAQAVASYLPQPEAAKLDEPRVLELIRSNASKLDEGRVIELVKANMSPVTRVEIDNYVTCETKDMGIVHRQFPALLKKVQARQASGHHLNIWLTGTAGSGKTHAAHQVAKALDLRYFFTGSIDNQYGLLGYMDANGKVVRTQFREAWENGGLFLFDEIDGSTNNAVLPLNAALANSHCAFPDAVIERHKDFVIVAAANTWGLGATNDYVGRLKIDAAFLDRFVQINWEVDEALETATCGNPDWAKRVQSVRARVKSMGIKVLITPRTSYYGTALLSAGDTQEEVETVCLRKAMTDDQWKSVSAKGGSAHA